MNKKVLVTVGVIVLVILLGSVGFLIYKLNDANKEREDILEQFSYEREQMEQNKSQLEQDYVTLSNDLEGFSLKVNNDSILKKLNDEQKRVHGCVCHPTRPIPGPAQQAPGDPGRGPRGVLPARPTRADRRSSRSEGDDVAGWWYCASCAEPRSRSVLTTEQ